MPRVGLEEVRAARVLLDGVVRRTPMEQCRVLEAEVGAPVYFKCENLQRTGSFKLRGAYVRISRLTAEQRSYGVVAASAGNHAQGVALAARMLGAASTVFMPSGAPLPKVAATASYGAEVHLVGETIRDALDAAVEHATSTGAVFIHPFDHPDIIAGQGSVGLEILEQRPDVRTVLVCTGGGGLVAGIGAAIKGVDPTIRVVGVQAAGAAAFPPSLAAGRPLRLATMSTMADGIAVPQPGNVTFDLVRDLVDEIVTVSEEALSRALLLCLERAKLVVEPAGAAGVAALMEEPQRYAGPVVAVLSGGNIDPLLLLRVMQHGLVAAGRYLSLRLRVPDRPGSLASILDLVAELGANVLDVEHSRTGGQLHLGEVLVALSLETRGQEHSERVVGQLHDAGFVAMMP
ncbi:MAG: threonine ammonia-lyase [Geodermatophilaceae bacterium]|nr:threonine ammonia-lyase [Geodermatophilaceae bacterium]